MAERLLVDSAARRAPWTLVSEVERLKLGFQLRPSYAPRVRMGLSVQCRLGLRDGADGLRSRRADEVRRGNEKHAGRIGVLHDPYPAHRTFPSYQKLDNPGW